MHFSDCFIIKDGKVSPQGDAKVEIVEPSPENNPFSPQANQITDEKEIKSQPQFTYSNPPQNSALGEDQLRPSVTFVSLVCGNSWNIDRLIYHIKYLFTGKQRKFHT